MPTRPLVLRLVVAAPLDREGDTVIAVLRPGDRPKHGLRATVKQMWFTMRTGADLATEKGLTELLEQIRSGQPRPAAEPGPAE
jgi:hypothetical protein